MKNFNEPNILPELASFIPPLTEKEREILEADILANGCREPITVVHPGGVIIDGHNRFEICKKHGIPYEENVIEFSEMENPSGSSDMEGAVQLWMLRNQLGRRNLSTKDRKLLIGRLYQLERKAHGAPKGNANAARKQSGQNDPFESTAAKIGEEFGVSESTVKRAGKLAEKVDGEGMTPEEATEAIKPKRGPVVIHHDDDEPEDNAQSFGRFTISRLEAESILDARKARLDRVILTEEDADLLSAEKRRIQELENELSR